MVVVSAVVTVNVGESKWTRLRRGKELHWRLTPGQARGRDMGFIRGSLRVERRNVGIHSVD